MENEISFDTLNSESGQDHIEGCYKLIGQDWKVFYFTHWLDGVRWTGDPIIRKGVTFQSGVTGFDAVLPTGVVLNNATVREVLATAFGVETWVVVHGPDSLQLK